MQLNTCVLYRPATRWTQPLMLSHETPCYFPLLTCEDDYQTGCTLSASPASFVPHEAHVNHCVAGLAVSLANHPANILQLSIFLALVTLAEQEVTHG